MSTTKQREADALRRGHSSTSPTAPPSSSQPRKLRSPVPSSPDRKSPSPSARLVAPVRKPLLSSESHKSISHGKSQQLPSAASAVIKSASPRPKSSPTPVAVKDRTSGSSSFTKSRAVSGKSVVEKAPTGVMIGRAKSMPRTSNPVNEPKWCGKAEPVKHKKLEKAMRTKEDSSAGSPFIDEHFSDNGLHDLADPGANSSSPHIDLHVDPVSPINVEEDSAIREEQVRDQEAQKWKHGGHEKNKEMVEGKGCGNGEAQSGYAVTEAEAVPTGEKTVEAKWPEGVMHGKKESALCNDVIQETRSKLLEKKNSKVKALVGAFETVLSFRESDVQTAGAQNLGKNNGNEAA